MKRYRLLAIGGIFIAARSVAADPKPPSGWSIFAYQGPSTMVPLVEIVKFSMPKLENYWILSAGASRVLWAPDPHFRFEAEGGLTKHWEQTSLFSLNGAVGFRWLTPPWERVLPGSFFFGNGLSYATGSPEVEVKAIGRTTALLYHIVLEYEFRHRPDSTWSFFFRDHHRSGAFGLFDGITGGSDYLCLGIRMAL